MLPYQSTLKGHFNMTFHQSATRSITSKWFLYTSPPSHASWESFTKLGLRNIVKAWCSKHAENGKATKAIFQCKLCFLFLGLRQIWKHTAWGKALVCLQVATLLQQAAPYTWVLSDQKKDVSWIWYELNTDIVASVTSQWVITQTS